MIKVLYTLDSLNRGGAEILLLDILRHASANGIDACLVACGGGDLETEFSQAGIDYVRLQRRLPIDPALIFQLRRIIKARNVDVVHVQQPVEALHAFLATRGLQKKLVFTHPGWFQGRKNRVALRLLAPRFDATLAVSEDTKELLIKQCAACARLRVQVIPTAVDEKRLACTTRHLRRELQLDSQHLLIGMIANFYPGVRKDHATVCRALARLKQSHPQAHLVFVGGKLPGAPQIFDDCVRLCVELEISDRVHFVGKRADFPDVLNSLDIFVLSSLHEGLPVALIAAMIVGLPCVASDIAPHREISGDGKFLRLFATGDAEALAVVLRELLDESSARQALGEAGRRFALAEFTIAAHLAQLRNVYKSLVQRR